MDLFYTHLQKLQPSKTKRVRAAFQVCLSVCLKLSFSWQRNGEAQAGDPEVSTMSEWPPQFVLSPASGPSAIQRGSHRGLLLKVCSFLGGVWVLSQNAQSPTVLHPQQRSPWPWQYSGTHLWSQDSEGEGREDQKFKVSLRYIVFSKLAWIT